MKTISDVSVTSARKAKPEVNSDGTVKTGPDGRPIVKRAEVAKCSYAEYETCDELIAAIGAKEVLDLSNRQIATNAKNKARAEAVGTPSEASLRQDACVKAVSDPAYASRIAAASGNEALVASIINEVLEAIKLEKGIEE